MADFRRLASEEDARNPRLSPGEGMAVIMGKISYALQHDCRNRGVVLTEHGRDLLLEIAVIAMRTVEDSDDRRAAPKEQP